MHAEGAPAQTQKRNCVMTTTRRALAVIWTLTIMALCWLPGVWIQKVEHGSPWFQLPDLDKAVHGGIFTVFSVLWLRATSCPGRYILVGAAGVALGALTEIVQNIPIIGRDAEVNDAIVDIVGVLVGLAVAPLVEPLLRSIETRVFRQPSP
jgi:hypothetical protein